MSTAKPEELYPVAVVAAAWHVSKNHIYDLITRKQLRSVDLSSGRAKTRIPASAVAEYLAKKERK